MLSSINQAVSAPSLGDIFSSSSLTAWARITKPLDGQVIEPGQDIQIIGDSSTGISKECRLSILLNNIKSIQSTIPDTGNTKNGVSKWSLTLHDVKLNVGQNTVTAQLSCSNPEIGSSHSITVSVVKPAQVDRVEPMTNAKDLVIDRNIQNGNERDGFDLVAAGDYGCSSVTQETVNKMKARNPNLFLALGDLSEDKDPACFFNLFSKIGGQLKVTLGEHDTDSNDGRDSSSRFSQFVRHFDLDKPFYSFDYKNVHFLAMSTGKDEFVPFGIGSAQYNFTANDLAKASNNKDIKWIIVYGYRPFYSSPTAHPASESIRDAYHPLFQKYGVDLVITTHNHNYQRTYPLKLDGSGGSGPTITDKNNSTYVNPKGPIFVTVGTAGEELHPLDGKYPFVVSQLERNGFLEVHVSNDGTNLTGSFYDSVNDANGDKFTISKF